MVVRYFLILIFAINVQFSLENEEVVEDTADLSDKRIIGGQDALPGQYPFLASLRYWHFDEDNQIYSRSKFCGGSIIAPRWVLTAAHCVKDRKVGRENDRQLHVALGLTDQATDYAQEIAVEKIISHPDFVTGRDDIALLFLEQPIMYNSKVQPISLPRPDYEPTGVAEIMGWGQTHPTDRNLGYTWKLNTLMNVPIIPKDECERISEDTVGENYICIGGAGEFEGRAACYGDSGGPLIQRINGKTTVVGVASLSHFICGKKPSKYEKVMRHINNFILPSIRQVEPNLNTNFLF